MLCLPSDLCHRTGMKKRECTTSARSGVPYMPPPTQKRLHTHLLNSLTNQRIFTCASFRATMLSLEEDVCTAAAGHGRSSREGRERQDTTNSAGTAPADDRVEQASTITYVYILAATKKATEEEFHYCTERCFPTVTTVAHDSRPCPSEAGSSLNIHPTEEGARLLQCPLGSIPQQPPAGRDAYPAAPTASATKGRLRRPRRQSPRS